MARTKTTYRKKRVPKNPPVQYPPAQNAPAQNAPAQNVPAQNAPGRRRRAALTEADLRRDAARRAIRTGRSLRSAGSHTLFPSSGSGRTPMQVQFDDTSRTMAKDWLPDRILSETETPGKFKALQRPNLRPRGIFNPGVHCYMNATLQAFMQMPQFLHWIRTHNRTNDCPTLQNGINKDGEDVVIQGPCVKCSMRGLVEEYWGHTDPSIPIPGNSRHLLDLKAAAFAQGGGQFVSNVQEDSSAFMEWVLLKLSEIDGDIVNFEWTTQFEALFRTLAAPFDTCRVCATIREAATSSLTGLVIRIHPQDNTVDDAIRTWIENVDSVENECHSETCEGANTLQERRWALKAAPRILKVQLSLFEYDRVTQQASKIMQALTIGGDLDLTQYQECTAVPLRYKLSAVVSHRGPDTHSGHYVASVRSQGPNPLYNINDTRVESINQAQFTANPQIPPRTNSRRFQAFILTYIRDEGPLTHHLQSTSKSIVTELKN